MSAMGRKRTLRYVRNSDPMLATGNACCVGQGRCPDVAFEGMKPESRYGAYFPFAAIVMDVIDQDNRRHR